MLKKILSLTAILVVMALSLVLPAWPGTLPVSIVPNDAVWVAHLDMEKFVTTKLFEGMEKEGRLQIKNRDITRLFKIDLFKDISGLTIFALGPEDKHIVIALAGRFDKKRLLTLFDLADNHREIPYSGNTIYSTDDDEYSAFINDGLIVIAERRGSIERVLDTAANKAKNFVSSELHTSFQKISGGAFLSGIIKNLAGLGRGLHDSKFLGKANEIFFTARENRDSFEFRAQVSADRPESAKDMADIAQGLIAMAKLGLGKEHGGERAASLLQGFHIKLEGATVALEFAVPSTELAQLLSHGRELDMFLD